MSSRQRAIGASAWSHARSTRGVRTAPARSTVLSVGNDGTRPSSCEHTLGMTWWCTRSSCAIRCSTGMASECQSFFKDSLGSRSPAKRWSSTPRPDGGGGEGICRDVSIVVSQSPRATASTPRRAVYVLDALAMLDKSTARACPATSPQARLAYASTTSRSMSANTSTCSDVASAEPNDVIVVVRRPRSMSADMMLLLFLLLPVALTSRHSDLPTSDMSAALTARRLRDIMSRTTSVSPHCLYNPAAEASIAATHGAHVPRGVCWSTAFIVSSNASPSVDVKRSKAPSTAPNRASSSRNADGAVASPGLSQPPSASTRSKKPELLAEV
eukprot:PhM_4_TR9617/c0_g1_i1/m.95223